MARELKRNTQQTYQAELADQLAGQRRLGCHRKELKSEEIIHTIQHYLNLLTKWFRHQSNDKWF